MTTRAFQAAVTKSVARVFKQELALTQLASAMVVLAPIICAAVTTGQTAWLRAGLVTISTFIAMQRSGLAPLGVLLHGMAFVAGFYGIALRAHSSATLCFGLRLPRRWVNSRHGKGC
jgi:hypothetical protein